MGYADGYYYGQGKIICDTATFTAGDTIRVRSMTDANKIWNKTVVTAGTPLIFEVPGKDYYKICTVQTISDVETEIGGVYKTIDYGQTIFVDVLDKTTLGGIQGILNAHQEASLLAIGDEVGVTVAGELETFVLAHLNAYASHSAIFCKKQVYGNIRATSKNYSQSGLKAFMADYYNSIGTRDKAFIKQKTVQATINTSSADLTTDNYVWMPTCYEFFGAIASVNTSETTDYNTQFSLFTTAQGRTRNGDYWTASGYGGGSGRVNVTNAGAIHNSGDLTPYYATLPCFMLTADA